MYKPLFKAAQLGDVKDLANIPDATLDTTDPAGNTTLHVAVIARKHSFAKELCKRRPTLLMKENMEGNTPLHCALKWVRDESLFIYFMNVFLEQVRDLEEGIKMGLKVNGDGESLLFLAADRESLEIVKLLLGDRVATDFMGPNGWTALHAAVFRRNRGIAKELLEKKPELNRIRDASGNTPLHYAAAYGDIEMAKCILDVDEDLAYLSNEDGHSALHVAAGRGRWTMVEFLIDRCPGCVMLKDKKKRNFLHVTVEEGHTWLVRRMYKYPHLGGLMRDRDSDGNTPLHLATIRHNHDIIYLLASMCSNTEMNPMNNAGQTPRDIIYPMLKDFSSYVMNAFVDFSFPFRRAFIKAGGKYGPGLCHLKKRHWTSEKLANNLLLVATLIITVTFAAIITMPGGFESDPTAGSNKGTVVLANRRSFQAFVILDTLAFLFAFWAAIRIIWTIIWRGSALVVDMKLAKMMVHAALMTMTLAFGTGAYSVLYRRCHWLGKLTLIMACVFSIGPCFGFLSYIKIYLYSIRPKQLQVDD